MMTSITIDGTERGAAIERAGFRVTRNKNDKPSMADFTMVANAGDGIKPEIDDEVIITLQKNDETTEKVFGGRILSIDTEETSKDRLRYKIKCIDYSIDADKGEPIAEIFEDMTGTQIITYLLANYPQLDDFTMTNVDCPETIKTLYCDHLKFTEVLRELADRTGYDYYIDADLDVHFYIPGTEVAHTDIERDNDTYQQGTMSIKKSGDRIVNWVIVRGGEYDSSEEETENFTANGTQTEFDLSGRYSGVSVTVAGTPQEVGAFGIDDEAFEDGDVDCLYNFPGKKIVFRDDNKPTNGQAVAVSGYQKLPVLVQADNPESIDDYDVRPMRMKRSKIKTIEAARQVASAQLDKFSEAIDSGSFRTRETFFNAGEKIQVTNSAMGVDTLFYIQSVQIEIAAEDVFESKITIASAEETDAVGVLRRILNQQLEVDSADEILQIYKTPKEKVTVADETSTDPYKETADEDVGVADQVDDATNKTLEWVHGEYTPTGFADSKRPLVHDSTPCHA